VPRKRNDPRKDALHGNPGRRPPQPARAVLGKIAPVMPEYLSIGAQKVWQKVVPDMERLEILDRIDEDILAHYCSAQAKYLMADSMLGNPEDFRVDSNRGEVMLSQWYKIYDKEASRVERLADKLGLTPSSRRRMELAFKEEEVKDPYAEFRKGKR
jgi:P27 family predicted phage terminase small subunit